MVASFHGSQLLLPPNTCCPQTIASVFAPLPTRRRGMTGCDHALTYHILYQTDYRSRPFLRTRSLGEDWRTRERAVRRGASLESFADDDDDEDEMEFVTRFQELAMRLHQESSNGSNIRPDSKYREDGRNQNPFPCRKEHELAFEPPWPVIPPDLTPAWIERKANSVDLPLSLRMIKRRKKTWEEGFREAGESARCSVKRAFSSMVFIIRELQSYTLQMRELLFLENPQGILGRVQGEMHASFVWLFQHIFSCTPTLMLSLMLLLANFTVYSMGHTAAIAAASPGPSSHSIAENYHQPKQRMQRMFDPSAIKTFSAGGRVAPVGGSGGGGGGKVRPVVGATDYGGSDGSSSSYQSRTFIPEGISTVPATTSTEEGATIGGEGAAAEEEEVRAWNRILEEASRMQAARMDPETLQRLVSPVTVELEAEDQSAYLQTELMYQLALSHDPDNSLLLSNFAQFIYLVLHDHDRAESYFKRVVRTEPVDAESLSRYAGFLWVARKDLGAAEETYLEAIAADPGSSSHTANYAHFLWRTGGEDTCYPLIWC